MAPPAAPIGVLRTVRGQHSGRRPGGGARYREAKELPAGAQRLVSPHDPDARRAVRRTTVWDGYKAHFTGTCDPGAPHLVVPAVTTPAAAGDSTVTTLVHRDLQAVGADNLCHLAGWGSAGRWLFGPARGRPGRGMICGLWA